MRSRIDEKEAFLHRSCFRFLLTSRVLNCIYYKEKIYNTTGCSSSCSSSASASIRIRGHFLKTRFIALDQGTIIIEPGSSENCGSSLFNDTLYHTPLPLSNVLSNCDVISCKFLSEFFYCVKQFVNKERSIFVNRIDCLVLVDLFLIFLKHVLSNHISSKDFLNQIEVKLVCMTNSNATNLLNTIFRC